MMELDHVHMTNYRQYLNTKIELARSPSENFTVIQGANGAGKTNLLNAITWCLFGKELHVDSKYAGLPLVNTTALEKGGKDLHEVKVELQFVQSEGKKMLVTRTAHYREGKDGNLTEAQSPHSLTVMRQGGREWMPPIYGDDAQGLINNLIPPSIEEYYFFDGERMDDYFKENTGKDIRSAVFQISQLELFEKLIEHLGARRTGFLKEARGFSPKAEEKRQLIEVHTRSLEVDQGELEILSQKKDEAEKMEKEFGEKLKTSSLEHIQKLEDERSELNNDLKDLTEQIVDIEEGKLKLLHKCMPVILAYDALQKTKKMIDGRREAGLIPPLYQRIFIENLLKKGSCICDSDITGKDEYSAARRKAVESCLEASQLSEKSNELIESNVHIQKMMESVVNFSDEIVGLGKKLNRILESKEDKEKRLRKIDKEIGDSNIENIKLWGREREKYEKEKNRLIGEIAKKEQLIERRKNIIRACNIELQQELKKEEKHGSLVELLAFCDEGIKSAQEVMDTIMRNVKEEIEKRTSQQFLALIWKTDTYKGVLIDDNYNISVPHVSGMEGLGTLSAGERQVCALSFMAALNSVSGFEVPIIIDTPLARISSEPSRNIARKLPGYLQGKQVVLLVTEKEYSPEVKEELSERVGQTYLINVMEKERGNLAQVELID
jgi:DNA sulfur modification protein DndD